MREIEPDSVSAALAEHIRSRIADAGGWVPFDRFMDWALYTPGLGYYAAGDRQFGLMPASGSDFVTAPELSPLFGQALAVQVQQGLGAADSDTIWEFGAGSGALAEQLLQTLGERVGRYTIVDVSGALRAQQQARLAPFGDRVAWADRLPDTMHGVVVGNEVLDAMPARLVAFDGVHWHERGVALHEGRFAFADSIETADVEPPFETPCAPGTVTELHAQAEAFIATLAGRLQRGLALLIDYGFPQSEYYHPQRSAGTLMCHRDHRADADPLADVGLKDITVHLNFTGIALAAQDAGMDVLGYTSQARFLLNCGIVSLMQDAPVAQAVAAHKLVAEHEMGELFKVIALGRGIDIGAAGLVGFSAGDRSHRL
jgi:SAM-dependent MidA family methyltransferase